MDILGKRIREERKKLGLTQEELGKKCGVTKYTISLYESNKSTPNDEIKNIMADLFGVSIDYLLGRDEPMDDKERKKSNEELLWEASNNLLELSRNQGSDDSALYTVAAKFMEYFLEKGMLDENGKLDKGIVEVLKTTLQEKNKIREQTKDFVDKRKK